MTFFWLQNSDIFVMLCYFSESPELICNGQWWPDLTSDYSAQQIVE